MRDFQALGTEDWLVQHGMRIHRASRLNSLTMLKLLGIACAALRRIRAVRSCMPVRLQDIATKLEDSVHSLLKECNQSHSTLVV